MAKGRIRQWGWISKESELLRVILLEDGETVHNVFFDSEREISENIYADLDRQGNLASMTIGHARINARLQELSYQEIASPSQDDGRTGA